MVRLPEVGLFLRSFYLVVILASSTFHFDTSYAAATCSCPSNGSSMSAETENSLSILINNQLIELQKLKDEIKKSTSCPSSTQTYIKELEKQAVGIQSLFGGSVVGKKPQSGSGFEVCTSALETFYSKVSNAAESNKLSVQELKEEREKFQKEKEDKMAIIEGNLQKKTENLDDSVQQLKQLINEKSSWFDNKIASVNESLRRQEKELFTKVSQVETFIDEKVCKCPAVISKLEDLSKFMKDSKRFEEDVREALQTYVKQQNEINTELEEKIQTLSQNQQTKFDESKKLIEKKVSTMTEKFSSFASTAEKNEETLSSKISEIEKSIPAKICGCPSINNQLDLLMKFMDKVKIHLLRNRYFLIDSRFTYSQAEDVCQTSGGSLASVPNKDAQILVENVIQPSRLEGAWIGLKSNGRRDGILQWADGKTINVKSKTGGYTNWHPYEPDEYEEGPVCIRIVVSYGLDDDRSGFGLWTDEPCDIELGAVCEFPI